MAVPKGHQRCGSVVAMVDAAMEEPTAPGAGADRRRGRPHPRHPRAGAEPPRAGHVRGHVVRALLVQVLAGPPAPLPDRGAVGARRAGRERRRGRRRRRHRRRDPHREPQPPLGHRALPGCGDRRRRHPPRHLHHGRPPDRADGPAALRSARRRPAAAGSPRASCRASRATATRSACRPSAARSSSTRPTTTTRSSTCCASGVLPADRLVLGPAEGVGNLAVLLGSTTGRDGIGGVSRARVGRLLRRRGRRPKRPSVQVGDPFEEKRLIEACLELLDAGLVVGIQDLGGAGSPARPARPPPGRRRHGRLRRRQSRSVSRAWSRSRS